MDTPAATPAHVPPPAGRHTVAVGDVHGCGAELERLFAAIDADFPGARVVMVGDLFTKGPEPGRVVRAIVDRRAAGNRVELVCGNHDLQLLGAIVRLQSGASVDLLPRTERVAIELLQRAGLLREATWLLTEACDRVEVRNPREGWTVVHERDGSRSRAHAACLTPDGDRVWGVSHDPDLMELLETTDVGGRPAVLSGNELRLED